MCIRDRCNIATMAVRDDQHETAQGNSTQTYRNHNQHKWTVSSSKTMSQILPPRQQNNMYIHIEQTDNAFADEADHSVHNQDTDKGAEAEVNDEGTASVLNDVKSDDLEVHRHASTVDRDVQRDGHDQDGEARESLVSLDHQVGADSQLPRSTNSGVAAAEGHLQAIHSRVNEQCMEAVGSDDSLLAPDGQGLGEVVPTSTPLKVTDPPEDTLMATVIIQEKGDRNTEGRAASQQPQASSQVDVPRSTKGQ